MEFFNNFENFIKEIDNENKEIIITGDFNCDMLDSN
jgi:exonuclease III